MMRVTFYLTDIMTDFARIIVKLFVGAVGVAFGVNMLREGVKTAKEVQEYGPSENWYED